ncbi:hypothetical protein BGX27_009339, partial [Mortierella sp. AM989]
MLSSFMTLPAIALFFVASVAASPVPVPSCVCTKEYNPVCAAGQVFDNPCQAKCAGYTDTDIYKKDQDYLGCSSPITVDAELT